jgi:hypothetical protein
LDKLPLQTAIEYIKNTEGKPFSCIFITRKNANVRFLTGVTGRFIGNNPKLDFEKHNLIPIIDTDIMEYKCIPEENIIAVEMNGVWYRTV